MYYFTYNGKKLYAIRATYIANNCMLLVRTLLTIVCYLYC